MVLTPLSAVQAALGLAEVILAIAFGIANEGTDDLAASIVFFVVIGAALVGVNKLASLVRFGGGVPMSYYIIDFIISPLRFAIHIAALVIVIVAAVNHVEVDTADTPRIKYDGFLSSVFLYLFGYDLSIKTIKGGRRSIKKNYVVKDYNNKIITLVSGDGEHIDFKEIAGIIYKGSFYTILQPKKLLDGMGEKDALVFKTTVNLRGEDNYNIELKDETVEKVFEIYHNI